MSPTSSTTADARPRVSATLGPGWRDCVNPAWLDGWTPRPFDLGDGVTDVVVMGEGPTVLLVPPLPGCKEAWIGCARRLARTFRIATFDLRDRFPGPHDWRVM